MKTKEFQNKKVIILSGHAMRAADDIKNTGRFMNVFGEVRKSFSGSVKEIRSRMVPSSSSISMNSDGDMRGLQVDLERNINQFGRGASFELSDMEAHYQRTSTRFFA